MAKDLKSYRDWLGAKLSDPDRAARYLNTALEDSEAMFLKALRKVATSQGRSMTEIADVCDVSRESLYRMLSESGNPTSENRRAILAALGLKSIVVPIKKPRASVDEESSDSKNASGSSSRTLEGNITAGRSGRLQSCAALGLSIIPAQLRKAPARALQNLSSTGHLELLQTGGGH